MKVYVAVRAEVDEYGAETTILGVFRSREAAQRRFDTDPVDGSGVVWRVEEYDLEDEGE